VSTQVSLTVDYRGAYYLIVAGLEYVADAIRYTTRERDDFIDTIIRLLEVTRTSTERLLIRGNYDSAVARLKLIRQFIDALAAFIPVPLDSAIQMIDAGLQVLENATTTIKTVQS
jgi:hypothetical protein